MNLHGYLVGEAGGCLGLTGGEGCVTIYTSPYAPPPPGDFPFPSNIPDVPHDNPKSPPFNPLPGLSPFVIPVAAPTRSSSSHSSHSTPKPTASPSEFDVAYGQADLAAAEAANARALAAMVDEQGTFIGYQRAVDEAASLGGLISTWVTGLFALFTPGALAPPGLDESQLNPQPYARALPSDAVSLLPDTDVYGYFASSEANPFNNPDLQVDPYAEPAPLAQPFYVPETSPYVQPNQIGDPFPFFANPGTDPFGLPLATPQSAPDVRTEPGTSPLQEVVITTRSVSSPNTLASTGISPYPLIGIGPFTVAIPGLGVPSVVTAPRPRSGIALPQAGPQTQLQTQTFPQLQIPVLTAVAPATRAPDKPPWATEPGVGTQVGDPCAPKGKKEDKKKQQRKKRDVCFKGTYYERSNGLLKFKKERIQCR